ncbi:MAG: DUF4446 family protein [Armatimonadia bacterium]|nr:DUF4446 family protein [Armatimonadia bacterium]
MTTTALTITVAVLAAAVIALGVVVYLLRCEVIGMRIDSATAQSVADALRDGRDEEAVRELLEYLEGAHGRIEALSKHARDLDQTLQRFSDRAKGHLQRVGVVRFDASSEVSGGLSCALCVLDAHSNGFLVTTLYDLSHSRTFVRAVRNGKTDRELLPEEAEALQSAMSVRPAPKKREPQKPAEGTEAAVEGADDA